MSNTVDEPVQMIQHLAHEGGMTLSSAINHSARLPQSTR